MLRKGDSKVALILARMKEKGGREDDDDNDEGSMEPGEGADEGELSAMEDLISAFKRNDAEAALEAWHALTEQCEHGE